MDEKQLLEAIRGIVQEETGKVVDEKMAANNEVLLRGVNAIVENKYDDILKLLREDYSPVAEAARDTAVKVADYPQTKSAVATLEQAVQGHNERIATLEQKTAI